MIWLLLPVLVPLLLGSLLPLLPLQGTRLCRYSMVSTLLSSLFMLLILFVDQGKQLLVLQWDGPLSISFCLDSFGRIFATLVSILWPVTTCYAISYMAHEEGQRTFFAFFLLAYGVVLGIALAGDLLTLYLFYELMTLATLPLVMHGMSAKARHAGRQYLFYSMVGAALVFVALMLILPYANDLFFCGGGILPENLPPEDALQVRFGFVLGFLGFGVKAAVLPFSRWLPGASIAPTPVTALLHAVAVVKAGAFSVGRLLYFVVGTHWLVGSVAQQIPLFLAALTILSGSILALRTPHFKRRLAYSTIANLSYILFAFCLMTPAGLVAGTLHLLVHAVSKICLFFGAGAVLHETGHEWLWELSGLARKMPLTVTTFTICSLSVVGIPPLAGFQSKWLCAVAAVETGLPLAFFGVAALITSSVFAALYLGGVILRVYEPPPEALAARDPERLMTLPMLSLAAASVLMAFFLPGLHNLLSGLLVM